MWVRTDHVDVEALLGWFTGETCMALVERMLALRASGKVPAQQFFDVRHEDLVRRPIETIAGIYDHFGMDFTAEAERRIRDYIAHKPKGKHGEHRYDFGHTGFDLEAGGLPGTVLNILNLDSAIGGLVSLAVEHFMGPLMNSALGGLAGPKQIDLLGKQLTFEMAADSVGFDVVGATVGLDTRMHLAGNNARFIYTPNAPIDLTAGDGFAIALSDDAANQLLASVTASPGVRNGIATSTGPKISTCASSLAGPTLVISVGG